MSYNPLRDMVSSVNQIVTPHLEAIGKNINDKLDRRLRRQRLEEKVIVDHSRLRLEEQNYEARLQSAARKQDFYEYKVNQDLDIRRRAEEAELISQSLESLDSLEAAAMARRSVANVVEPENIQAIDAELAGLKAKRAELEVRAAGLTAPTAIERTPPPTQGAQLNMELPTRTNDQLGFDGYDSSTFVRQPAQNQQQVKIKNFSVSPEEREMMIRVTAAEVGGQTDQDGYTMLAETVRNRSLFTGKPVSELITPRYYETMRGESSKYDRVVIDSPEYEMAAQAVDNALSGSNLSNSALHNYYGPQFTESRKTKLDYLDGFNHQNEAFYRKTFERDFDFNNYVESVDGPQEQQNEPTSYFKDGSEQPSGGGVSSSQSLFPDDLIPDGGEPVKAATPEQYYGPQEAEDQTEYNFSAEDEEPLRAEPIPGQDSVIINDEETMGARPPLMSAANKENESQQPVAKSLSKDQVLEAYRAVSNIPDAKLKSVSLSNLRRAVKQHGPELFDDEINALIDEQLAAGVSSRVDFEKSIDPDITELVGNERAIQMFTSRSTQYKVEQQRVKDFEDKSTRLKQVEKDLREAQLAHATESEKVGKDYSQTKVDIWKKAVDAQQAEFDKITNELAALQPKTDETQALTTVEPTKEPELSDTATSLLQETLGSNPIEPGKATISNKPIASELVSSIASMTGIMPEFLSENDMPSEPFGFFEKYINTGAIQEATDKAINAYVLSEKKRYNDPNYTASQTDFQAVLEFISDPENLKQLSSFANSIGYSVNTPSGKHSFTNYEMQNLDPVGTGNIDTSRDERALRASPSDAVALVKTFLKKDLRTKLRDAIVSQADRIAQSKKEKAIQVLQSSSIKSDL